MNLRLSLDEVFGVAAEGGGGFGSASAWQRGADIGYDISERGFFLQQSGILVSPG
jgi:hypothetical protein